MGGGLTATLPGVDPVMDQESAAWVAALAGQGGNHDAASTGCTPCCCGRPGSSWAAAGGS